MRKKRTWALVLSVCVIVSLIAGGTPKQSKAATKDPQSELLEPTKLASFGDVELWGEKAYTFTLPCDRELHFKFMVKNTGQGNKQVRLDVGQQLTGTKALVSCLHSVTTHPQPNWMYLKAGESGMVQIDIDCSVSQLKNVSKASVGYPIDFTVTDYDEQGLRMNHVETYRYEVTATGKTYSKSSVTKGSKCSVKICGYLKDSKGKPIKHANVMVTSGWALHNSVFTNEKGYYSVKVMPYYSKFRKQYAEYVISPRVKGYKAKSILVLPKKSTIKKNIILKKQNTKMSYTQTKKIPLGIQAYDLDASKDGSVIATVPFHTMLPKAQTEGKRTLLVTTKTGKELFRKALPSETPYVDVSDNGEYVLVTSEFAGNEHTTAILYDKTGKEVYRTPDQLPVVNVFTKQVEQERTTKSYCARLSHDNRIVAYSSTEGDFWMIDWQTGQILWQTKVSGQVRTIDFSEDDKEVYISEGGGYVYCFDVETATQKWKSFIQAWGTEARLTKKYYIVTTKCDGYALMVFDRKSGEKVWDYPVTCRGTALEVSADEKLLFWGNDKGGEYTPLNAVTFDLETGKIKTVYRICEKYSSMAATFSRDGKKILIKHGFGFGVYNTDTGEPYCEKNVVTEKTADSLCFSLYASDNLKYVVAGFNSDKNFRFGGDLYFFKGNN
jgi:outer membrane protein assembly factor BamB